MSEADEDVLRALDVDSLIELIAALRRDYALVVDERDTYRDNAMPEAATIMNTLSADKRQLQDRLSEVEAERDRLRADQMVTAEQEVVIAGLRKKLATIVAERDRLRAVVDAARGYLDADEALRVRVQDGPAPGPLYDEWVTQRKVLRAALDQLDGSEVMGDG